MLLRAQAFFAGARLAQCVFRNHGIDLGEPLALRDLVAEPDLQRFQLPGHLRADVDLLTAPAANPVAFLTGSKAAKAFGAFSYRYFPDGTIQPDARWVSQSTQTATVPILGTVTCHRVMLPQLRGALQEVVDRGLAAKVRPGEYGGCFHPRYIGHDPAKGLSLHSWGIAVDLNVPGNLRGTAGEIDREVVAIFKRWGFAWGGDWGYTDPMHFEMNAIVDPE